MIRSVIVLIPVLLLIILPGLLLTRFVWQRAQRTHLAREPQTESAK